MAEQFVARQRFRARVIDKTEAAGIVETQLDRVLEHHHCVIVRPRRRPMRRVAKRQSPRHAEMGDQHAAVVETHEDVFGATVDANDAPAFDAGGESRRDRLAQIGAVQRQPKESPAFDARLETAYHGLDFRQFGHGLVSQGGGRYGAKMAAKETADFGYRRVPAHEHARLVRDVFDRVARRYDLMNDLMSGGIHRLWKAQLVERLGPQPRQILLDVAGGTGDIARRFVARAGPGACAIVCDINARMLAAGRDRSLDAGEYEAMRWLCGNAEALPIADASVDAYTIAFGLRNVTRIAAALAEARRVLKPGGRFLCLEFSNVENPALQRIYDLYSFAIVPRLGAVVARDRAAYQYLVESIRRFPDRRRLAVMMEQAGFDRVTVRPLSGGIAAIHSGWRL